MNTIKFGFIGAGQISHSSAASINSHPRATLVAAQDTNAARLKELEAKFGVANTYATAEELFADNNLDAVYIATPNKFHVPLALQALEAGKHVILEKPFAMNYPEALQAAETARRLGKVLTLGMNQRFEKAPQTVRSLIEAGTLGEIYHTKAHWLRRAGIPKLGTWFGNRELSGGGCLYDIGVHFLDLSLYLMDNFDPVSVSGATYTKFGHLGRGEGGWGKSEASEIVFDVDDFATGFIRMANGATLSLDVSWACHAEEDDRADVHLYGTEAGAHAMKGRIFRQDPETGEYLVVQNPKAEIRYPHCDRFHNFINHLVEGEELCVSLDQALTVQKILDAMAESAASGREVRLDS
jgi:predicted dehydrogenase